MSTEPDVLYVADMARKLGRTESAIRSAVNRAKATRDWPDWLPPCLNQRRLAWLRQAVDAHLQALQMPAKPAGAGRKAKASA